MNHFRRSIMCTVFYKTTIIRPSIILNIPASIMKLSFNYVTKSSLDIAVPKIRCSNLGGTTHTHVRVGRYIHSDAAYSVKAGQDHVGDISINKAHQRALARRFSKEDKPRARPRNP